MDWKPLLQRQRARSARPNGMQGHKGSAFDMARYWRGGVYLEADGSLSEAVLRANAFKRALEATPKRVYQDTLFAGEQDWLVDELPSGVGRNDFDVAAKADRACRGFWGGYDHTIPNYPELLRVGISGLLKKVGDSRAIHIQKDELAFLDAVEICLEALSKFILSYAEQAIDAESRSSLERISLAPPSSFRDAMQLIWLVHIAMSIEGRGHNALGRLDQWLLPFYEAGLRDGSLSREKALGMICHLWCMVEGMHEVTNICVGGLKRDGSDAANELSYLCLEATKLVRSPSTNLSARFHDASPDRYHRACAEVIISGIGFPAIFNDHTCIPALVKCGIPVEDAREYAMVGCIEPMIPGRQQAWSDGRFNTPLYLLQAIDDLPECGPASFEELFARFQLRMREGLAKYTEAVNAEISFRSPAKFPDPFLSSLTSDCIGRARDVNAGGAEFKRLHGVAQMGLGTITDSLAAIRKLVIEERTFPFSELRAALKADFKGFEPLRQALLNGAPKYGNADPYADQTARRIVKAFSESCSQFKTCDGGHFVPCVAANIQNISAGLEVGATPDGRKAGTPLSDAASPYYGRDLKGPTAFIESVSAPDYTDISCSVVNMRFLPEHFAGPEGIRRFTAFTKAFVAKRIQELQFNFNDDSVLRAAIERPEEYAGLVVRVSGFSAYFTTLDKEVQHDIMRRRAHGNAI